MRKRERWRKVVRGERGSRREKERDREREKERDRKRGKKRVPPPTVRPFRKERLHRSL